MQVSVDLIIRQRFTKIIDSESEALEFGEEAANYSWSFAKGFGDFEVEFNEGDD
jgi:hypothetical protein